MLPLPLALIGGVAWHLSHETATAATSQGIAAAPPDIPAVTAAARTADVPIYLFGLGQVQAFNTVTVKARIDGQIDRIAFTEGQDVAQGALLAQIDPRPLEAMLAQAQATKAKDEAQLGNAKSDLNRVASLVARDFATQQRSDTQKALVAQMQAAVQGDQAAIDSAKVQLGYTTITAPISGRVGIRSVDQGNIVHANDAGGIVVITQLKPISVIFTLPQDSLDQVTTEMAKGRLQVVAFKRDDTTRLGEGTLALVDNQIDPSTGTIRLKATFPNEDLKLWPGGFVNAKLLLTVRRNAVTVPLQVIQRGPKGAYAYVVKADRTVEARQVTLGPVTDGTAIVEKGLAAGERVVVDGQYKLRPGFRIIETDGDAATPPPGGAKPAAESGQADPRPTGSRS